LKKFLKKALTQEENGKDEEWEPYFPDPSLIQTRNTIFIRKILQG